MSRTTRTAKKSAALFEAIAESGGNVTAACKKCRIPRRNVYEWRNQDPKFADQLETAIQRGADALESECVRRAFTGTLKPVFQGGERVGTIREFSDVLAIFLLKGAKPDKYRERRELSGPNGAPLTSPIVIVIPDNGRGDAGPSGDS